MKRVKDNIGKTDDLMAEEAAISFAHLTVCFTEEETVDGNQCLHQGFPYSHEERLYETGILLKEFLKC